MASTPKINKIIRMTEFDMLRTNITTGNMYMCLDTLRLYYDESNLKRSIYNYVGIKTINDLMNNTTPNYGTSYYCWEDNSLWIWMNHWKTLYTDQTYPSAYIYNNYDFDSKKGDLEGVYRYDEMLIPADDNGLLKDGSVVIRDRNRIIKGKIYVNDDNDNLTVGSYLGGGIRFLPNGKMSTEGEFFVGDENDSFLRSELTIKNAEEYIDYTEKPETDTNPFKNDTHRYKVFHEGNLDASKIKEMTPLEVYNKLLDPTLPDPLMLNVNMLNGKSDTDFAPKEHTHTANNITDFNVKSREQAAIEIRTVMTNLAGEGITIEPKENNLYRLSANTFSLNFGGGVTGSGRVNHLTDTTINLTVNPDRHIHQSYIDRMDDMQKQINNIDAMDKNDYYTKSQTDGLIDNVKGTTTPTPGKALLVDKDGMLPGTTTASTKLSQERTVNFIGDVTGTLTTDWSSNQEVELNADNILSNVPTPGKALKVDNNGNLPANAETASALDHNITINLTKEVTGSGQLDTSKNSMTIQATLVPGENILQSDDLGVRVPPLENGKIPANYLSQTGGLTPKGKFDPNDGYPSENPQEGDFWIASTDGVCEGVSYNRDDWCAYLNGEWTHIQMLNSVTSVNGKIGAVTLNAQDVGAISDTLINYSTGSEIPNGYIVRTSASGEITGCGIERLNEEFNVNSDSNSDVEISSASTNKSTDGTEDLGLKLMLTQTGYDNIKQNTVRTIQSVGSDVNFRKNLNFDSSFNITDNNTDTITISLDSMSGSSNLMYIQDSNNVTETEIQRLTMMYNNRKDIAFVVAVHHSDGELYFFSIDSDYEDLGTGTRGFSGYKRYIIKEESVGSSLRNTICKTPILSLQCDGGSITSVSVSVNEETVGSFITAISNRNPSAFMASQDWQPATKSYVDSKLSSDAKSYITTIGGQGAGTTYTIKHNLGTQNIVVQFRYTDTKEECLISNTIVDNNTISVTPNTSVATGSVTVYILSIL